MTPTVEMLSTNIARIRSDLDAAWITEESRMRADLGISSVEMLNLLALVTQATGARIKYEPLLLEGGRARAELTVGELATFIDANRDAAAPAVVAM